MDLESFTALLTASGKAAIQAAAAQQPREADFLRLFTSLSAHYPPGVARAALETAILRQEAGDKFPFAGQMYFTRPALEQATSYSIAAYRAQRLAGFSQLADLGCSIGGDTLALVEAAPTLGVDLDPLRLHMAQANLAAVRPAARVAFIQADLAAPLPLGAPSSLALFFDPARRSQGRRVFSVRDYSPPLAVVHAWLERYPAMGVKISPGVRLEEIQAYPAEVEFISLAGELKEAVLWFGPLRSAAFRATLLPGPHSLTAQLDPVTGKQPALPLAEPQDFLYEPDPAILRAGLVETLGARLEAAQLDPDIAYLTSNRRMETPFARIWRVEGWLPFNLKRLRAALRERGVGRVVVKKRGSPLQPEALIRDLRLSGDQERTLFLTHLNGQPVVILADAEATSF